MIALAAAALRILLGALVIDPLTAHFWPPPIAPSGMNEIAGHGMAALRWLLLVWTFTAFGEIGYRGYLINQAADAGGRSEFAYWAGLAAVSVLFGYGHFYKGPAGILDSGMAGLIWGLRMSYPDATCGCASWLTDSSTRLDWLPCFSDGHHEGGTPENACLPHE